MDTPIDQSKGLPRHRLGQTEMQITRVGFGSWAVGGDWAFGWGSQDDRESVAAIRHAVERGVNWIDTAAIYGSAIRKRWSRRRCRKFRRAERPYVFTKCGLIGDPASPNAGPQQIGAPRASGGRSKLAAPAAADHIDLYQMHWPADDGTPLEEYWQTLLELKQEGKVAAVGLSNHTVAQIRAAEQLGHVDTLQPPFSAIRRQVGAAELAWCAANGRA